MSVFCGQCGNEYASEATELNHTCKVTGVKPTEPESMGKNWDNIATLAIERGEPDSTPSKTKAALDAVKARKAEKEKQAK